MFKFSIALAVCLVLSGCGKKVRVELTENDYRALRPALINQFVKNDILRASCADLNNGNVGCSLTAGWKVAAPWFSYDARVTKYGHEITLWDTQEFPVATLMKSDLREDLVDNTFVTEDGRLKIEFHYTIADAPCPHRKKPGQTHCCVCQKHPVQVFQNFVVISTQESVVPSQQVPQQQNPKQQNSKLQQSKVSNKQFQLR